MSTALEQVGRKSTGPGRALLGLGVLACVCVYAYWVMPGESRWAIPCLFHQWTGLLCPGCGSTRALHSLLHGRVLTAAGQNPVLLVVLPVVLVRLARSAVYPEAPRKVLAAVWIYAIFAALVVYWILRNLPAWPFTLLAP